jgi:small subunit ribosomal protein S18
MSFKKFTTRKKFCRFCAKKELVLDYKNTNLLLDFVNERGKIIARRVTGTCAKHQRVLTTEINRARQMALMYYTATHSVEAMKRAS